MACRAGTLHAALDVSDLSFLAHPAQSLFNGFNVYSMFLRSTLDTSQARRLDLTIFQEIFQS